MSSTDRCRVDGQSRNKADLSRWIKVRLIDGEEKRQTDRRRVDGSGMSKGECGLDGWGRKGRWIEGISGMVSICKKE